MAAGEPFSDLDELSNLDRDGVPGALDRDGVPGALDRDGVPGASDQGGAPVGLEPGGASEGPASPQLPVRDPAAASVRPLDGHLHALEDLEVLRRVLAGLRRL